MLDELLKEINELKECKNQLEYAKKDKQRMSDLLFELMTEKYERTPFEDRAKHYKQDMCRCCRGCGDCEIELPEDIEKPIKSVNGWIPGIKSCGCFEWS